MGLRWTAAGILEAEKGLSDQLCSVRGDRPARVGQKGPMSTKIEGDAPFKMRCVPAKRRRLSPSARGVGVVATLRFRLETR